MDVGCTATRNGLTQFQLNHAELRLRTLWAGGYRRFHHGDCTGGDAQLDALARKIGFQIVIHPPKNPISRAFCYKLGDTLMPEKGYIPRNHDIVNASNEMIACPKERTEQWRGSGTWATIRFAHKAGKNLKIIFPTGE